IFITQFSYKNCISLPQTKDAPSLALLFQATPEAPPTRNGRQLKEWLSQNQLPQKIQKTKY
ncbi:MAG: hypothetical protein J6W63_11360, partial [Treponema sp.]|nr:hypothetical protein [Treponema sp.]